MKKISNQFVVNTVEDGESAPYYFQEWFAWSNVESTVNATTSPFGNNTEPNPAWSTSIPENTGGLAYLWSKSIRYVWNESTRQYAAETAQYYRKTGTNGTSIKTKGSVSYVAMSSSALPTTGVSIGELAIVQGNNILLKYQQVYTDTYAWATTGQSAVSDGDAYICAKDSIVDLNSSGTAINVKNHLIQYNTEASKWIDLGQFKGEAGATYYTHIAWATSVTLSQSELPIPSGQTNRPNALAANISGFSITPLSGVSYAWMGYLIDTNSSDSQTKQNYTWQMNKGEKGDDASEVNPNILLRTIFDDGIDKVKEAWSSDWTVASIDAATDTVVQGRKSLRINMTNGQTEYCDLFQVIFGKLKASTWYTVSFNYFATQAWNTFLHSDVASHPAYYDASAGIIIDGVMQTMSGNNGKWQWPADWTGKRHTITFKTASDLSGIWDNSQLLFRVPQGCQLALCMPKLEIGQVATAYMANEDDLRGVQGKIGRFFYFGGTFDSSDSDPTHTFVVNDAQAPYFEHTENGQKRYHVFNYETNGSYTMSQMWAISSNWNNKPWEAMTNDFKYIITEALFSSYAHLGSWIFNGDYMISEKDRNGNPRGQREYNGMPSNAQVITGFIPSVAFDAANGRVSFCGDRARFNPDGSGWFANKNIQWDANGNANFYGKITATSGSLNNIVVGSEDGDHLEIGAQDGWGRIDGRNAAGDGSFSLSYALGFPYIDFTKEDTNSKEWAQLNYQNLHFQKTFYDTYDTNELELRDDLIWLHQTRNDYTAGSFTVEFDSNNKIKMMASSYITGGDSVWPEYSYVSDPSQLDKGSVQVMNLGSLKALFDDPTTYYGDRLRKLSVLIVRNNATY